MMGYNPKDFDGVITERFFSLRSSITTRVPARAFLQEAEEFLWSSEKKLSDLDPIRNLLVFSPLKFSGKSAVLEV